ncbi:MAG: TadE family protein [Nitrospirota bacterium]
MLLKAGRRLFRDDGGAAMVELAIVLGGVFLPLVFGVVEFGRMGFAKTEVTAAAREGVRFAIVHGTASGAAATQTSVSAYVKGRTQLTPINVTFSFSPNENPGSTATVQVTYTYTPIVRILPSKVITSTSQQVIAY